MKFCPSSTMSFRDITLLFCWWKQMMMIVISSGSSSSSRSSEIDDKAQYSYKLVEALRWTERDYFEHITRLIQKVSTVSL